jgi:2-polyprenyl-3-methyl-5-hydroxy-6-metoxy-1,4-benzoquinol methylase
VLDAGCGAGPALRYFSSIGYRTYGCDFIFYPLVESRKLAPDAPVVCCDLKQPLPYRDASFDTVLLSEVVEHLHETPVLLRECWRVLRPGGYLLITTPNLWDIRRPLAWLTRRTWSGYTDPTHTNLFTPARLRRTLAAAGFEHIRLRTGLKPVFVFAPRRLPFKLSLPYPPFIGNGIVAVGRKGVPNQGGPPPAPTSDHGSEGGS